MYRFSRSIYCELAPYVKEPTGTEACTAARQELLQACERTIDRLLADRRYFARPVKTLFSEVRNLFALNQQVLVHMVIERHLELAVAYLESLPDEALGIKRQCPASTRKGTPCRRDPRPGLEYCPSHRHLEDGFGVGALPIAA